MKDNQQELFPIVDEEGTVIGKATRGECHSGSRLLHPVVHLHVFNSQGEVYLQKRPDWKDIQPGKWDTAVGGHIDDGETPESALQREAREVSASVNWCMSTGRRMTAGYALRRTSWTEDAFGRLRRFARLWAKAF